MDSGTTLETALAQLDARIRPDFRASILQRDWTLFQFNTKSESFHLQVTRDDFAFAVGRHPNPTLNLFIPSREICFELLTGKKDSMQAFLDGEYRSDGNILLSQLLLYLFLPTQADFQLVKD